MSFATRAEQTPPFHDTSEEDEYDLCDVDLTCHEVLDFGGAPVDVNTNRNETDWDFRPDGAAKDHETLHHIIETGELPPPAVRTRVSEDEARESSRSVDDVEFATWTVTSVSDFLQFLKTTVLDFSVRTLTFLEWFLFMRSPS
jgi:hypothetical protein